MDTSLILHKGRVTHVIDPSSFWMRMGTDAYFLEFEVYQTTLDQYYNKTGRNDSVDADSLSPGDCVMVADTGQGDITLTCDNKSSTECHWNRAKVSRVDDDKVDVFYIDLGYTEIVNISNVKNVNQELFDYLPSQVIQLGIAGIKPLTRSWTSRAIAIFESKVLKQDIVASLIEYDDTNKYGQVVLYIRQDDCTWHSLTYEMLDEELGLPIEPKFNEYLSQETVLTALKRAEQEQESSTHSPENDSDEDGDDDGTEDNNTVDSQKPMVSTLESDQTISSWTPESHSAVLMLQHPPGSTSQGCENSAVEVPAFDLRSLNSTRFLSLSKMQEDKNEEHRQQMRARLEQEIQDGDEDEEDNFEEIEWGKTDLQIGELTEFPDFDNSIRQEIYKHSPRQSSQEALTEFFHETTGSHRHEATTEPFDFQKTVHSNSRENVHQKPLSEIEDYKIQKKIEEILLDKGGGELELVCALINSIIEPDLDVPCDCLVAIFTAILETLIRHSTLDRLIAFGALETYLNMRAFEKAIETALKSLAASFIKLPQTIRSSGHHRAFAEVLAILFIHANHWPTSAGSTIQTFVMTSIEHWTVFNKQRAQSSESHVKLEHLYLECVETITDIAWAALSHHFPERCCSLIEEIKHKLLHDSTNRIVRIQLLNILLKRQTNNSSFTQSKPSSRDVAIQTDNINGSSIIIASQDSSKRKGTLDRSTDKALYRPFTGRLYIDGDQYTADHDKTLETSEIYLDDPLLDHHKQDCNSNTSTALLTLLDTGTSNKLLQTGDNKMQVSQTVNKLPAHQDKKLLPDKQISRKVRGNEITSLQQPRSDALTVSAPDLTVKPTSFLTEQLDKTLLQSDALGCRSRALSQNSDGDTLKPRQFSMELVPDKEIGYSRDGTGEEDSFSHPCVDKNVEHEIGGNNDEIYGNACSSTIDLDKSLSELNFQPSKHVMKPTGAENKLKKIKYTSDKLKALNKNSSISVLNTNSSISDTAVYTVNEACEIDFAVEEAEIQPKSEEYRDVKPQTFLSSVPIHRYSGSGDSPIEISEGPKSNAANWKSLSELLPASYLKPGHINSGTSVDSEVNDDDPSVRTKSNSLIDIAKGLIFPTGQPQSEDLFVNGECNAIFNNITDECTGGEITNFCESANSIVANNESDHESYKYKWPDNFFKSIKPLSGEDSTSASAGINFAQSNTSNVVKGKKKKIKFRPVSEVFAQKPSFYNDTGQTDVNPSDLGFEDNLNGDLQTQNERTGGQIIHQSRLGAVSGRSSNRSSLLADLRQDRPKADPWVPGKRKCTWCGSEDHTIYDCTRDDSLRNMDDKNYIMYMY